MQKIKTPSIYTLQFGLLCTSSFLFFASFSMIIPELPGYLSNLGGAEFKGLIIGLFTISAALSRPFSGKLADTIGRIPVIYFGVIMSFLCGLLYPVLTTVSGFLFLRFLHGFSTGFTPTGTSAYVADIVPIERRGEALGILGLASNIGTSIGPALGSELTTGFSINFMFYTASGFALLSMLILMQLKETLANAKRFHPRHLDVQLHEIIEPRVLAPALTMLLVIFPFGIILTIIPDFSEHLGLRNKGVFFSFYTLSSLLIRFLSGKASDRFGRVIVLKWGIFITTLALIYIGLSQTSTHLLTGACILGVGVGMTSPTLFAWTIDLSVDAWRGRALSTLFIALEIGILLGSVISAEIYANKVVNFAYTFWVGAAIAFLGWLFLQFGIRKLLPQN